MAMTMAMTMTMTMTVIMMYHDDDHRTSLTLFWDFVGFEVLCRSEVTPPAAWLDQNVPRILGFSVMNSDGERIPSEDALGWSGFSASFP